MQKINEQIKKAREKLGLSQGELAKKTGVSQQKISKMEIDGIPKKFIGTLKLFQFLKIKL